MSGRPESTNQKPNPTAIYLNPPGFPRPGFLKLIMRVESMDDGTLGAENRGHQPQIGPRSESADDTGTVEKRGHPHLRARAFEKQVSPPGFLPDLSIEARLDRISEQVDACLEVLVKGRLPAVPQIPSLKRQLSSLSGRGGVEPVSSSQSSRQNMIPFTVWDRAETREMTEEGPPANEDRENAALTEEEVPSRKHARPGKAQHLEVVFIFNHQLSLAKICKVIHYSRRSAA
eukprot:symbB.v1.2.041602.t1/scaffold8395.1/size6521/1